MGEPGPLLYGYEQRLAHIGRFLDDGDLHAIAIVEVEGGMLVRATRHGHREPELFELPDAEPASWPSAGPARRGLKRLRRDDELFRDGYTASLTTLGRVLDLRGASAVVITEGDRFLAVGGLFPAMSEDGSPAWEPVADLLFVEDVKRLEVGEVPAALGEPGPLSDTAGPDPRPAASMAASAGRALERLSGRLAGSVTRLGRRAQHIPRQAAADTPD